ncbi:HupE/UreJ family protein [Stutzerimonas chloritidismutans]|uniref:HupE/UreJ family protein n=1 Tax=Stutzerimonas chloritidismutans TaxID=203192 RepID=A0ABU9MFQ2_STUCH
MSRLLCPLLFVWLGFSSAIWAHEIRPAYLQIDQISPSNYDVLWKVPSANDAVPDIEPQFDSTLSLQEQGGPRLLAGFVVFRYRLSGDSGLLGTRVQISNLALTTIDVLVNLNLLDGSKQSFLLHPTDNAIEVPRVPGKWTVVQTYIRLGIEHILLGIDHLLFVLALIILVSGWGNIIKTVTAFTVAHSITLSLAALGHAHVPGPPVEATIALSIMFLALELLRKIEGKATLTSRKPWLVAFTFGLLHGLGFAGALAEIGLPQTEIPLALACFNIGVELGQVAFVAVMLLLIGVLRRRTNWSLALQRLPAYAIGSVSAFWVVERTLAFAL